MQHCLLQVGGLTCKKENPQTNKQMKKLSQVVILNAKNVIYVALSKNYK